MLIAALSNVDYLIIVPILLVEFAVHKGLE